MRTVSAFRVWAGMALVLLVAEVPPAEAIINGTIDATTTAVGVVTDGTTAMASAVLIDPWWVLTSATFATAVADGWFAVGSDYAAPDATYPFSGIFPHTSYDPETGFGNIALIRLAAPVSGVAPIPCQTTAAPAYGDPVRYVGYGAASTSDFDNTIRRSCVTVVDEVATTVFQTYYDGAGPYFGDGGGPALLTSAGTVRVAGIIASMEMEGTGATTATRVSSYASFIAAVMAANPPLSAVAAAPVPVRLTGVVPNPFNPRTEIAFELAAPAPCRLTIYDLRGREVIRLADRVFAAGRHAVTWDGRDAAGGNVASGTFLVVLRSGDTVRTSKALLVR